MAGSHGRTGKPHVSCLIADDNPSMVDALASVLREAGIEVAGIAHTGVEALHLLERCPATAIVLDIRLPDLNGLDVARLAAETAPKIRVIFHTSYADSRLVRDALEAGARAVVLKGSSCENVVRVIYTVAAGRTYIDPRLRPGPEPSER
jgi:DNA-binding NarL/FixJ family response regulator